ncbi:MAG: hypothetical protein RIA69_18775 [Cyclobacteriaceae bacterium]|uniref:hypothetical protein n=1 Tax=Fulvivirga sp. TaxID=1931237 RepID=UPI0032EAC99D
MKKDLNIVERVKAPTPKFFKTLRNVGLILAAAGGYLLAAPITLPATVVTVAGYLTVAGGVMSAVSQAAVDGDELNLNQVVKSVNGVRRKVK